MERKKASDFPQELLNLFDGYVHGRMSRRDFLDGAQKFAVGGVTAAALFEMLKPNYAWAIQVPKDDSRIKAESATVSSPEGNGSIKGYLVRPANATVLPLGKSFHWIASRLGVVSLTKVTWSKRASRCGSPGPCRTPRTTRADAVPAGAAAVVNV